MMKNGCAVAFFRERTAGGSSQRQRQRITSEYEAETDERTKRENHLHVGVRVTAALWLRGLSDPCKRRIIRNMGGTAGYSPSHLMGRVFIFIKLKC